MEIIHENTIVEAIIGTSNALSKGNYEIIEVAWKRLDRVLKGDISKVNSKVIDNAVDVFQTAGLTLCELKELKRK